MRNPAIVYKKEMDDILPSSKHIDDVADEEIMRWNELYGKCYKECTHKDEDGNPAWRQMSEDLLYCPYCSMND